MTRKQNSIMWFIDEMYKHGILDGAEQYCHDTLRKLYDQAEKKHEQEIVTAYAFGHNDGCRYMNNDKQEFEHGEEYYQKTYNK